MGGCGSSLPVLRDCTTFPYLYDQLIVALNMEILSRDGHELGKMNQKRMNLPF